MQLRALIVDSFRESRDRKIFWVMLAISLLVASAMFCVALEPGKINVLFGLWEFETDFFSIGGILQADIVSAVLVEGVMDVVLGSLGIVLAIVATAGFIPTFMDRGVISVVLAKPIPRWKLFLGRYLGGMLFIAFHATVFVASTFLVAGLRWKTWLPGYLLAIPLMVLLFSYLYCVSALVGVFFRSTVAAVLLTLAAWLAFTGVQTMDDSFVMFPKWQEYRSAHQAVRIARWIVPKTQDITYLAKRWSGSAKSSVFVPDDDVEDRELLNRADKLEAARMAIPAYQTIGSSLLFEAFVVFLAMAKFRRMDF